MVRRASFRIGKAHLTKATIASLLVALPMGFSLAQKAEEANKPTSESAEESKATSEPEENSKTEAQEFATRKAIIEFFDPLRGEAETKLEELKGKEGTKTAAALFEEIRKELELINRRHLAALETYIAKYPNAEDTGPARYDVIDFHIRFGDWEKVIASADAFLRNHSSLNQDLTRQASYFKADALFHIEGKESEAEDALRKIIATFPESIEARFARANLYRVYLLTNKIVEAKRLWTAVKEREEVKESEAELSWIDTQLDNLNKIGTEVPAVSWISATDQAITSKASGSKPTVLWFWQSTSSPCLEELTQLKAVAKELKNAYEFRAVSLNKELDVWKQFVRTESKPNEIFHYFEGFRGKDLCWRQLGVSVAPTTIVVDSDNKIFRFDVPMTDLGRTLRKWKLDREAAAKTGD